jgi:hypothetical protein
MSTAPVIKMSLWSVFRIGFDNQSTEALHTAIESALPLRLGSLKALEKKQPHP